MSALGFEASEIDLDALDAPIRPRKRNWRQTVAGQSSTMVADALQRRRVANNRCQISFGMVPIEADVLYAAVRADGTTLATFMRRAVRDAFIARGVDVERELPALCYAAGVADLRGQVTPPHLRQKNR